MVRLLNRLSLILLVLAALAGMTAHAYVCVQSGSGGCGQPVDPKLQVNRSEMAAKLQGLTKSANGGADSSNGPAAKNPQPALSTRDIMPESPEIFSDDPEIKKRYAEALTEYYRYRVSGYQHRQNVFMWQLFSSKFIFVTVLLLVFLGMYFAALQFHAGLKFLRQGKPEQAGLKTDLEISPERGKIDSPVLGVVILLLSLAFFYLYLLFVYPVHDTF